MPRGCAIPTPGGSGTKPAAISLGMRTELHRIFAPTPVFMNKSKWFARLIGRYLSHLPYGERIDLQCGGRSWITGYTSTLPGGPSQKFTQEERDPESNLEYFLTKYGSGA